MLTYCTHTHTHRSIHQSDLLGGGFLPCWSRVFILPASSLQRRSLACNQRAPSNTHQQAKRTQARTHKVAGLVGAMAAALLRGPRVAPGARLPVVCQRLRVEFIQIKAVE